MRRPLSQYHVERHVRRIATTALTLVLLTGAAAPPAATPARGLSPVVVTPDTAERRYGACLEGAPTTPDTRAAWTVACRDRVASGRS